MAECYKLLRFIRVRIARLEPNGVPDPGAGNLIVSDSQVSLAIGFNNRAGADFESTNGEGRVCYSYQEPDEFKNLTLALTVCDHNPEMMEMMVGGDLITVGGNNIGYALPSVGSAGSLSGVSLEGWTYNIDGSDIDSTFPYVHWVFPKSRWTPADKTLENGPIANAFTGIGYENSNYFDGPANDHPDTDVSGRLYSFFGDDAVPDAFCGAASLAAS